MNKTKTYPIFLALALAIMLLGQSVPFVHAAIYNVTPSADSYVQSSHPTSNYGTSSNVLMGYCINPPLLVNYGFFKFSLASVPDPPTSAIFYVYVNSVSTPLYNNVYLNQVTDDSWTETGVTWNNQPLSDSLIDTTSVLYSGWVSINVTDFVIAEYGGDKTVSLLLIGAVTGVQNLIASFDSREGTNQPYLLINTGAVTSHSIVVFNGSHGSISPSGTVTVPEGGTQSFYISGDKAYQPTSVSVDAEEVNFTLQYIVQYQTGVVYWYTTYNFTNVSEDHNITATFGTYSIYITASASGGGSISPSGIIQFQAGASPTFTMTPNSGYHLSGVYVNDINIGGPSTYTFPPVTYNNTINAVFSASGFGGDGGDGGEGGGPSGPSGGVVGAPDAYIMLGMMISLSFGAIGYAITKGKDPTPALFFMVMGIGLTWWMGFFPMWIFIVSLAALAILLASKYSKKV